MSLRNAQMPYNLNANLTDHDAARTARAQGLVVRTPNAYELLIDLDNLEDEVWFDEAVEILRQREHLEVTKWPSKSGNTHALVTLDRPVGDLERIALQAILGSDRKHEMLCYFRMQAGCEHPTVFFEKPDAVLQSA